MKRVLLFAMAVLLLWGCGARVPEAPAAIPTAATEPLPAAVQEPETPSEEPTELPSVSAEPVRETQPPEILRPVGPLTPGDALYLSLDNALLEALPEHPPEAILLSQSDEGGSRKIWITDSEAVRNFVTAFTDICIGYPVEGVHADREVTARFLWPDDSNVTVTLNGENLEYKGGYWALGYAEDYLNLAREALFSVPPQEILKNAAASVTIYLDSEIVLYLQKNGSVFHVFAPEELEDVAEAAKNNGSVSAAVSNILRRACEFGLLPEGTVVELAFEPLNGGLSGNLMVPLQQEVNSALSDIPILVSIAG